ncbi:uncharacterized protein I206_101985 [Kwoniella pini CBS 10737]|uniref:BZIP domain-containing protein n=1 Tax=Kwoniella pini CBS 10737 TaxID=1296096 RepID=A0A1B9HV42_9TREE|nr:uncharacterized protein I206_06923 [Kwoniella pini CBS 10737]OCF47145.1 hypothetical protein I206_06923 [Kwoniella pini CBS 10737]
MFPDLPEHLQALNALPGNTPPSAAMNPEQEEAFWGFLHADELFRNFGNAPSPSEQNGLLQEDKSTYNHNQQIIAPAPTPIANTPTQSQQENKPGAPTLESFIAAYIGQSSSHGANTSSAHPHALPPNYLIPIPTPYTQNSIDTPQMDTPAGINTSDVLPGSASIFGDSLVESPEDRISGAKRLKQLGAPQVEIEEDKRRRNTEASARFRAKKKEREQALERRAKDLEAQLAALQSENTSLENENRLLKAIVLNGPSGQSLPASITSSSNGNPPSLQAALASLTQKRKRED